MDEKESSKGVKKKKRKRNGAYARRKGHNYELKIINELKSLLGYDLVSSRSESKRLDDAKIDIADLDNKMSCYVQCKCTKVTPSIQKLNEEVGLKDKPLAIFWNKQESREVNMVSAGEYVIVPKDYFYKLLKKEQVSDKVISKIKENKNNN